MPSPQASAIAATLLGMQSSPQSIMVDAIDACMFSIVCISITNVEIRTKAQFEIRAIGNIARNAIARTYCQNILLAVHHARSTQSIAKRNCKPGPKVGVLISMNNTFKP